MTNQEIFDLMDRFQHSTIQSLKLSMTDFSIELTKAAAVQATASAAPVAAPAAASLAPSPAEEDKNVVAAPLVGTFYAAPAPDQPPFVTAGQQVKKGDTLCLIEAMKMMSEVPAPADCVVEEILAKDGEAVGVGAPLFRIRRV